MHLTVKEIENNILSDCACFIEGCTSQSKSEVAGTSLHLLKTAAGNRSRAGSANEPVSEVSGGSMTSTASDSCKTFHK